MEERWRVVGIALLFSVPPGIGLMGFLSFLTARGEVTPIAIGGAVALTVGLFAMIYWLTASAGEAPARPEPDGE